MIKLNKIKKKIFQRLLPSVLIYFVFWTIGSFEQEIFLGLLIGTLASILILIVIDIGGEE
ncbi:MAG TPA: hypothetical protein VMV95_02680 [Bacillota bacterium]|nr:hypothetical protein [Bacillota bacterium]